MRNYTNKPRQRRTSRSPKFELYERIKSELTASAKNAAEYAAACQRAAKLAGI